MQLSSKKVFDAYKNIGQILGSYLHIQKSPVVSITSALSNSYKVYDSQLKIQNISPIFPDSISGIYSHSNSMYVRCGTKLFKMSYSHIVKEWEIGTEAVRSHILIFGELIILAEEEKLILIDGDIIDTIHMEFRIKGILHPNTYVNKIIVYGLNNLELWNVVNKNKVYDFSPLFEGRIFAVVASPKIDVVGILNENNILLFNLKTTKILFQLVQKQPSECLTFSEQGVPLLATSDKFGTIRIWSLQTKNIIGVIKAHQEIIDYLQFIPGELTLLSASKQDNSIKQWKYDETEAQMFRKLRERSGLRKPIQDMLLQSNTEVIINSEDQTMYLNLISQNNNYILPKCLDSLLPTHIVKNGQKLQIYKNQTKTTTLDTGMDICYAKISQSQNYFVVEGGQTVVRLGGGDRIEWKLEESVQKIVINQPYYIFALTYGGGMHPLPWKGPSSDFSEDPDSNPHVDFIENISVLQISLDRKYIVYGQSSQFVVMNAMTLQKIRVLRLHEHFSKISFSNDNRFLIMTTSDSEDEQKLIVWDIFHNNKYKQYSLGQTPILSQQMTPDGSFLLSVFDGERKISVWNNFLGVVPVSEIEQQELKFETDLVRLPHDLRQYLNNITVKHDYNDNVYEEIEARLDEIPDANQSISFTQQPLTQWIPLIHYDQIKERNRPVSVAQKKVEAPFFLDSESKTNFINKMDQQYKQQVDTQSRILNEKQYKLMEENSKKIKFSNLLNQSEKQVEYDNLMKLLKSLSLAELDYELNTLVFDPQNIAHMSEFFEYILTNKEDYDLKIVYYYRFLSLLGTSVVQNQNIKTKITEWKSVSKLYEYTSEVTERLALKTE